MLGRALHYVHPHCVIKNYVFLADYDVGGEEIGTLKMNFYSQLNLSLYCVVDTDKKKYKSS